MLASATLQVQMLDPINTRPISILRGGCAADRLRGQYSIHIGTRRTRLCQVLVLPAAEADLLCTTFGNQAAQTDCICMEIDSLTLARLRSQLKPRTRVAVRMRGLQLAAWPPPSLPPPLRWLLGLPLFDGSVQVGSLLLACTSLSSEGLHAVRWAWVGCSLVAVKICGSHGVFLGAGHRGLRIVGTEWADPWRMIQQAFPVQGRE